MEKREKPLQHFFPGVDTHSDKYSWRRMRRAAHQGLHQNAVEKYKPIQTKEATLLLNDLLQDSGNWVEHVRR